MFPEERVRITEQVANMLNRSSVVIAGFGYGSCVVVERESLVENDTE